MKIMTQSSRIVLATTAFVLLLGGVAAHVILKAGSAEPARAARLS
jgi:hypothetical protein